MLRGVESRSFLRDHPTPLTTAVATGPATVEYNQPRMYTVHVAAPTPLMRGVVGAVRVESWRFSKHEQILVALGGIRVRELALDVGQLAPMEITKAIAPHTAKT